MNKLFKLIDKYIMDIMIFMMLVALLILEFHFIWDHNKDGIFQTSCYILCWICWYFIWKRSEKRKHECDVLKALCAHLVVDNIICDKKKPQDNPDMKVPVWRKCGPGHAFKEDAIVVGLGEDKDPRLVKCAVNASIPSYVLIPFKHYAEIMSKETPDDVVQGMNFRTWLAMSGLTPYIMTPDYLKDHITL